MRVHSNHPSASSYHGSPVAGTRATRTSRAAAAPAAATAKPAAAAAKPAATAAAPAAAAATKTASAAPAPAAAAPAAAAGMSETFSTAGAAAQPPAHYGGAGSLLDTHA